MARISSGPLTERLFSVTSSPSITSKPCASRARSPCSMILSTARRLLPPPCSAISSRISLESLSAATSILSPRSK